jgi:hypothetical protein
MDNWYWHTVTQKVNSSMDLREYRTAVQGTIRNLLFHSIDRIQKPEHKLLLLAGQQRSEQIKKKAHVKSLAEVEFRVYSQGGEDGILQYLLSKIDITHEYFIEFGVGNYREANTRFLLLHDNWSGLLIEGNRSDVDFIRKDPIYWSHDLTALNTFITKDNISELIRPHIPSDDIGLLSIDIDGNDYWVLNAIDVVRPRVLVCEYNNTFGAQHSITIPYSPDFARMRAHHSGLYFGASLKAIANLADSRGYDLVGTNSDGTNAFFVRRDLSSPFNKYQAEEAFVRAKFRESRNTKGGLTYLSGNEKLDEIEEMQVINLDTGEHLPIGRLFNL